MSLDLSKIKLVSSNENKLNEYRRFGLNIEIAKGLDLKEVDGSVSDIMTYKAIDAGENHLVEDTIIGIEGLGEMVDIRARINELPKLIGKKAYWVVSLCVLQNGNLYFYSQQVNGTIGEPKTNPDDGFGFDPYFYPEENNPEELSLHQLEMQGKKDLYSARKRVIDAMIMDFYPIITPIELIPEWTGGYQNINKE